MALRFAVAFLLLSCSSSSENRTPGASTGGSAGTAGASGGSGGSGGSAGAEDAGSGGADAGVDGSSDASTGGMAGASPHKIVFITNQAWWGDFAVDYPDAHTAGDDLCTTAGAAIDPTKTWRVFLSTSAVDAPDRVELEGEWYLPDQLTLVFPSKSAWTGFPLHGIDQNELGETVEAGAWTGTYLGKKIVQDFFCTDWTSDSGYGAFGYNKATDETWSYVETDYCGASGGNSLYCFEL
jgi:hypothetical protein